LPAPELARRPIELSPELLIGFASCAAGNANDARCTGLSAGLGAGGNVLWRVSPYFAFGGAASALSFGFQPPVSSGLHQASAHGLFVGVLGRVYFLDHGPVEPYLELGLGAGSVTTSARESDEVRYDESAVGGALRVGGALEFYLSEHVRLGPAFAWTRFDVARVNRCAGPTCVRLDQAGYGHGTGFSSLSVRLSILLGPGS
jgi:opacity protein-like surface antigen